MGKKASKMYDKEKAPALDRDEAGNVKVKEGKTADLTKADETESGTEGVQQHVKDEHGHRHAHERREMKHRHMKEHLDMHHKHEMEHTSHEGPKEELHDRHEKELKDMHTHHEHEQKAMHTKHEKESMAESDHSEKHNEGRKPKEDVKPNKAGEKGEKDKKKE